MPKDKYIIGVWGVGGGRVKELHRESGICKSLKAKSSKGGKINEVESEGVILNSSK